MKITFRNLTTDRGTSEEAFRVFKSDDLPSDITPQPDFEMRVSAEMPEGGALRLVQRSASFDMSTRDAQSEELNMSASVHNFDFRLGEAQGAFRISGLGAAGPDRLDIVLSDEGLDIRAQHSRDMTECQVTCGDGTQGTPCVTCRDSRGRSFQVCC